MSAQGPVRATDKENTKLDWETPRPLFVWRNSIWKFDIDAAANATNSLLGDRYFGPGSNHMKDANVPLANWTAFGHSFFSNPEYGRGIMNWLEQYYRQSRKGALIECLIPANTGTRWFSYCKEKAASIELLTGRVGFWYDGKPLPPKEDRNTSDSMLVQWRRGAEGAAIFVTDWKKEMVKYE